jgi:hypothetical protein
MNNEEKKCITAKINDRILLDGLEVGSYDCICTFGTKSCPYSKGYVLYGVVKKKILYFYSSILGN